MSIIPPLRGILIRVAACAGLVTLAGTRLPAQTVLPNASPAITGEGHITFVGHYGEVLELEGGWEVRASMQGEAEVINLYPGYRWISKDLTEPFHPKPEDFAPGNFTPYRLIQLIILPWTASSSKSLAELKQRKIADLKSSGVEFRILDDPFPGYGHMGRKWPKGTFEVLVATPYKLSQLYTTSGTHLAILTTGVDTPPSTVIAHHYDSMRMAVRDWVVPATGNEVPQTSGPVPARVVPVEGISLNVLMNRRVWVPWIAVNVIACLLLAILAVTNLWAPLRRACLSMLIFSNGGALIGGLIGLCFWPFALSSPHLPLQFAVASLCMPLLAWLIGRVRGRRPRRRAMIGTWAWAVIASAFFVYISLVLNAGTDLSPHIPAYAALIAFPFYALGGIIFGLLDSNSGPIDGGRALLTFILLLTSTPAIWAQPVLIGKSKPNPIDSEIFDLAREKLAKHNLDRESFRNQAADKLRETEVLYEYQRVEIKGIFAKDLTHKSLPNLFDEEIGGSHVGDKGNDVTTPAWVQEVVNHLKDLKDLHADAHGQFTETARKTVEILNKKEVNEIVAHSWGTEIVYNAILHGDIKPPRRVIVCGMPDRDREKWIALSKYTGTEVVVYPDSRDPIAGAARLGGAVIDALAKSEEGKGGLSGEIPTPKGSEFEAEWEARCRQVRCNEHSRQPAPPQFKPDYKGASHNRLLYYRAMLKDGTFPLNESDAYVLRERQEAKITAEADRLYAATVAREAENHRPESTRVKADEDFFGAWYNEADKISRDAQAAQAIQEADRAARLAREAEEERLSRERAQVAAWQEIDASATGCGYAPRFQRGSGVFLGYDAQNEIQFFRPPFQSRITVDDYKIGFLLARGCYDAAHNPDRQAPYACNGAATLLRAFAVQNDVAAKLNDIFGPSSDKRRCIEYILDPANKVVDSASFIKAIAKYQKQLIKERVEHDKNWRTDPPRNDDEVRGDDRPPRDNDRTRDCFKSGDPFGCQPRHR